MIKADVISAFCLRRHGASFLSSDLFLSLNPRCERNRSCCGLVQRDRKFG
jgi:hypothetical protein